MWRAVVVLVLTSFAAAMMGCAQRQPPLEATLHWESEDLYVGVAVPDSTHSPGLVNINCDNYVQLSNLRSQPVVSTPFMDHGTFVRGDMAGATGGLVWATCKRNDSLFVVDVFRCREMFVTSGIGWEPGIGWDGSIRDVSLRDINADGKIEAVVVVWSGVAGGRGIYVLNWMTGEPLWHYRIGPSPTNVLLRDVDGDGKTEILLGTIATGNGDSANSTDDFHTYVLLLKSNGERGWIQRIGKHSSFVMVSWLVDSSSLYPPILATEIGFPAGGRTCDSVFVLDSRDGSMTARARYGTYNTMQAVVSDKVGMSVLLGGADDTLRCLDPVTLKLRNKAAMSCGVSSPSTVGQNSIGSGLAVVPTTDGRLLVVSPSLQVMCNIVSGASQTVYPVSQTPVSCFLASGRTGDRDVWRLYSVAPTPVLHPQVGVDVMVGVSLLLFAMFGAALVVIRYRLTYDMRIVIRGLTGQAGVVELNLRGDVKRTNPKARELLGGETLPRGPMAQAVKSALAEPPGSQPKELPVALDSGKTVLARAARVRSGVMLTLEDISAVEYLQRVKAWAPVAQKLAHGIKNPLGTIMGAVEQIEAEVNRRGMKAEGGSQEPRARDAAEPKSGGRSQNAEGRRAEETDQRVKKYIGYVKDEVTRLKKMTDAFMRFTKLDPPALEPKNVNEIVRKVVARYGWENGDSPTEARVGRVASPPQERAPVQSPFSKGISLELSLDERLPLVALDEEGIANVLDIVLENAIEAMSGEVGSRQNTVDRVLRIRTACRDGRSQRLDARSEKSEGRTRTSTDYADSTDARTPEPLNPRTLVSIEVEDTGMGVPQKYLDKVFEPYFTYGKADGTGLGLALAKKIVEDHKGRMEIASVEGEGTTVAIILPTEASGK